MTVEKFTANVGANIREFVSKMKQVDAQMRKTATGSKVNVDANIREFTRKMVLIRAQLAGLSKKSSKPNIDADTSRFTRAIALLKAKMLALSKSNFMKLKVDVQTKTDGIKKLFSTLKAGYQDGQAMMGKIATSMRNFGEMVSTSMQGAFMAVLPAISPILANVGALIGNLGVMIGVVGGQAVALGLGAATAFAGFGSVMAMAIGNVKELYAKNAKLNAQQKATKASIDQIKTTYNGLVTATQKPILSGVNKGAKIASGLLTQLKPLFMTSAKAFDSLMTSLKQSIGSTPVQDFIKYLNTNGAPMMSNFAKGVGSLFKGLASIFVAFAPLTQSVAKGFENMGASFAKWGEGLKSSQKMKDFMSYVQTNMPKISSIFGNAIVGVVNFFSAFGGSASGFMTGLQNMMIRWREWSSTLSSNQAFQQFLSYVSSSAPKVISLIGNLVTFLVNLGIGMAPLGAKILELVNGFLAWTDSMMKAHPIISQVVAVLLSITGVVMALLPWILTIGTMFLRIIAPITQFFTTMMAGASQLSFFSTALQLLGRGFAFLTGPIGIAIAIITTVISVLTKVYQTSEIFRAQVSIAFNAVKNAIVSAMSGVASFITSTWAQIKSIWTTNSAQLQTIGSAVWTAIKAVVVAAMAVIMAVMTVAWPVISAVIQSVWAVIKHSITTALAVITGVISVFSNLLTGNFPGAWQAMKTMVITIITSMANMGRNILTAFKNAIVSIFKTLQSALSPIWNAIKSTAVSAWNGIKSAVTNVVNSIKSAVSSGFNAIKSTATSVWNAIKSATTSAWNGIKSAVTSAINAVKSAVTSGFNAIKSAVTSAWNAVKSATSSAWNGIKSVVSSAVNGIKSVVSSGFNAVKSVVSSAMNGIRSAVTSGFNAIRSAVTSAMSSITSAMSSAWSSITSAVSSAISSISSAVSSGFNALVSVVSSAMSSVLSAIKGGWDSAISYLRGIDLTSIGSNIIQGLLNGIKSKVGAVISTVQDLASKVTGAIKKAMDIHSPSRVTDELGQHTGQGFANGIAKKKKVAETAAKKVAASAKKGFSEKMKGLDLKLSAGTISTATYIKQAKDLAKQYSSVINAQNTVNAKITKASTTSAVAEQKRKHALLIAQTKAFNTKLAKLDNAHNSGATSDKAYIKKVQALAKQYKDIETIQIRSNAKVISAQKKVDATTLNLQKQKVSKILASEKVITKEQLKTITDTSKKYAKGTTQRIYFENQYAKAVKQNNKLILASNKTKVDNILANESKSAVQQLAYIKKIADTYKAGTTERAYFEQQAGEKKEEIYEGLMDLNDKYTKLILDSNAQLKASEQSLNDEYDKTVSSRAESLSKFTALFSEVSKTADVTSGQLKANLQDQVTTLKEWSSNINSLMEKGVDGTLLAELRELGPNASAEISALNTMTESELAEYQSLWNEKSTFANGIALTELSDLRKTTDEQITALRAETATQLATYNAEWQEEIKKLTGTSKKTFDAMVKSMPAIGANVIKGMQQGLTSMTPALLAQAQSIANSIKSTIQSALDIHSPSRWGDKVIGRNLVIGIANGINNMTKLAVQSASDLAESVKSELTSNLSTIDGLAVSSEMKQSVSKELSVKVKVEVEGDGGNGLTGGVVINNQYDTRNLNESELARQQKRQMQTLGLGY